MASKQADACDNKQIQTTEYRICLGLDGSDGGMGRLRAGGTASMGISKRCSGRSFGSIGGF